MKKYIVIFLMLMAFMSAIQAQTTDTMKYIDGRCPRYYYTSWYDQTTCYHFPSRSCFKVEVLLGSGWVVGMTFDGPNGRHAMAKQEYAIDSILISGVAIMIKDTTLCSIDPAVTSPVAPPDTCFIFTLDSLTNTSTILAMARWDTASPKVWRLPMNADTLNGNYYSYVKVYEVTFPTPVAIEADSHFYIAATQNCNAAYGSSANSPYLYPPKHFANVTQTPQRCITPASACSFPTQYGFCQTRTLTGAGLEGTDSVQIYLPPRYEFHEGTWGVYLPILGNMDTVALSTAPNNPIMGHTTPVLDSVPRWFYQTITAYPNPGYEFIRWNDGSTENPRRVRMANSMYFTALFDTAKNTYNVMVDADETRGSVSGAGTYREGDTAVLRATPFNGYLFHHWSTGSRRNPYRIRVTGNIHLTAHFYRDVQYQVTAIPNDNSRGSVSGGGTYYADETAELTATPHFDQYYFSHWHDGDTNNPRSILVQSDTTLTAIFLDTADRDSLAIPTNPQSSIFNPQFSITPNPTTGHITITLNSSSPTLTLRDAAGHELIKQQLTASQLSTLNYQLSTDLSSLPSGAYFITLSTPATATTPAASSTQRLLIK